MLTNIIRNRHFKYFNKVTPLFSNGDRGEMYVNYNYDKKTVIRENIYEYSGNKIGLELKIDNVKNMQKLNAFIEWRDTCPKILNATNKNYENKYIITCDNPNANVFENLTKKNIVFWLTNVNLKYSEGLLKMLRKNNNAIKNLEIKITPQNYNKVNIPIIYDFYDQAEYNYYNVHINDIISIKNEYYMHYYVKYHVTWSTINNQKNNRQLWSVLDKQKTINNKNKSTFFPHSNRKNNKQSTKKQSKQMTR